MPGPVAGLHGLHGVNPEADPDHRPEEHREKNAEDNVDGDSVHGFQGTGRNAAAPASRSPRRNDSAGQYCAIVDEHYRPWHLTACAARDAAVTLEACTCPPERWLDSFAEPVLEAGDGSGA